MIDLMGSWRELYAEKATAIIMNTPAWVFDPSFNSPDRHRYLPGKVELVKLRNLEDHLGSTFGLEFEVSVRYRDDRGTERSTGLVFFFSRGWTLNATSGSPVYVAKA